MHEMSRARYETEIVVLANSFRTCLVSFLLLSSSFQSGPNHLADKETDIAFDFEKKVTQHSLDASAGNAVVTKCRNFPVFAYSQLNASQQRLLRTGFTYHHSETKLW